jgi:hypothetical protein
MLQRMDAFLAEGFSRTEIAKRITREFGKEISKGSVCSAVRRSREKAGAPPAVVRTMGPEDIRSTVRDMTLAGCTTAEVARAIGMGKTKVHSVRTELGLVHRVIVPPLVEPDPPPVVVQRMPPEPPPPLPVYAPVRFADDGLCRFPMGDTKPFGQCPDRRMGGRSYCPFHSKASYQNIRLMDEVNG